MKIHLALPIPNWLVPKRLLSNLASRAALTGKSGKSWRWGGPAASVEVAVEHEAEETATVHVIEGGKACKGSKP